MDHADQPTPGIESEQAWRQYGRYSYKQFRKWTKEGEHMNLELAPSILSADFGNLAADMAETARAGARYAHIDVMDGMFVPQISLGMPQCHGLVDPHGPCLNAMFLLIHMVHARDRGPVL